MPRHRRSRKTGGAGNGSVNYGNAATTQIRGSIRQDRLAALPLLGDKFENRKMMYFDKGFELTSSTGLLQTYSFRANDVYDPDATGGGHQPVGFDQAMLFWEQFCVFSSKIQCTFTCNSNAAIRVGIFLAPDTTTLTVQELMENGFLTSEVIYGASGSSAGGSYHVMKTVSLTSDNVRYFSSSSKETYFANRDFSGTSANSPTEMNYFTVFAFNASGSGTYDCFFDCSLSYDVRFWEPRKLAISFTHEAVAAVVKQKLEEDQEDKKSTVLVKTGRGCKASKKPP
jgi:hypothetical protein